MSKTAEETVVPMRAKQNLVLTDAERLTLENVELKLRLLQEQASKQAQPIMAERAAMQAEIGERLGIEFDAYRLNLQTGELSPINGGPETGGADD